VIAGVIEAGQYPHDYAAFGGAFIEAASRSSSARS